MDKKMAEGSFEKNAENIALRSIYFQETATKINGEFDPLVPGQALVGQFRILLGRSARIKTSITGQENACAIQFFTKFEFFYSTNTQIPDEEQIISDADKCVEITAEIAAEYLYPESVPPNLEDLGNFANSAVINHVWPYWREFAHGAMTKMNLPLTIMPLLVLRHAEKPVVESNLEVIEPTVKKRARKQKIEK